MTLNYLDTITMNSEVEQPNFDAFGLNSKILSAIDTLGYKTPTPIQATTIPVVLKGRDVLGQAQTGTGKTAAFALPLLNNMDLDTKSKLPQVLVLTPTRELAIQVAESFKVFSKNIIALKTISIYGGQDYNPQIQGLRRGVEVVVGTAGRIMDHMRKGTLKLDNLKALVLDEADEMLRMGFIDDVQWVLSHIPEHCQRLLFSATMPLDVINIVNTYLRNPVKVQIKTKTATAKTIHQRFFVVKGLSKIDALDRILECEESDGIIIFVKTKSSTIEVADSLKSRGHSAVAINGDMQQSQREHIINQLKLSKINILVATDVVARGLDVERISHVINYDLPQDNDAYVHRIGRTGRAGRQGDAISLIYTRDIRQLRTLERVIRHTIKEMKLPSALEITQKRVQSFKNKIVEVIQQQDLSKFKKLTQDFESEHNIEKDDMLAALALLAQTKKNLFVKEIKTSFRSSDYTSKSSYTPSYRDHRNSYSATCIAPKRRNNTRHSSVAMSTYRVEVGKIDGVEPRNLVGAIANETSINSSHIGQIRLFDKFSTVELPKETPENAINYLKNVWVSGKKLSIRLNKY